MIDVVHSELSRRLFEAIEISGEVGWPFYGSRVGVCVKRSVFRKIDFIGKVFAALIM